MYIKKQKKDTRKKENYMLINNVEYSLDEFVKIVNSIINDSPLNECLNHHSLCFIDACFRLVYGDISFVIYAIIVEGIRNTRILVVQTPQKDYCLSSEEIINAYKSDSIINTNLPTTSRIGNPIPIDIADKHFPSKTAAKTYIKSICRNIEPNTPFDQITTEFFQALIRRLSDNPSAYLNDFLNFQIILDEYGNRILLCVKTDNTRLNVCPTDLIDAYKPKTRTTNF